MSDTFPLTVEKVRLDIGRKCPLKSLNRVLPHLTFCAGFRPPRNSGSRHLHGRNIDADDRREGRMNRERKKFGPFVFTRVQEDNGVRHWFYHAKRFTVCLSSRPVWGKGFLRRWQSISITNDRWESRSIDFGFGFISWPLWRRQ
jgi:hypothetical protein